MTEGLNDSGHLSSKTFAQLKFITFPSPEPSVIVDGIQLNNLAIQPKVRSIHELGQSGKDKEI